MKNFVLKNVKSKAVVGMAMLMSATLLTAENASANCPSVTSRLYVRASILGYDFGNGSSWLCGLHSVKQAVDIANANPAIKSIWVATKQDPYFGSSDNSYKLSETNDRTATLNITRTNLKIVGGFAYLPFFGAADAETDSHPEKNPTIISGAIGGGGSADNSLHLVKLYNLTAPVAPLVIKGLIFEGGNANVAGGDNSYGGAVIASNVTAGAVSFTQCVFRNNAAAQFGGAVFLNQSAISFSKSTFASNSSVFGGGVAGFYSSPSFSNSVFISNSASSNGGGFFANYGSPSFENSVFANNTAGYNGGGSSQVTANASYSNVVFTGNTAAYGGGIFQSATSANSTVINSTFYNNTATLGGGMYISSGGSTTTTANSILYSNAGGDLVSPGSTPLTLVNNTVGEDPLFLDQSNPAGADGKFITADDGLQLVGGSVAIGAGDDSYAPATDILGNARVGTADNGAYEFQLASVASSSTSEDVKIEAPVAIGLNTGIVANPFSSDLQIKYAGAERAFVTVYDFSGKAVYNGAVAQGINHVNASNWGRGMYQVVLSPASGKKATFKVVKL